MADHFPFGSSETFLASASSGTVPATLPLEDQPALASVRFEERICALDTVLFGKLQRYQLYGVVLFVCAVNLVVSPIWLRHFRFGPLEWLWRSLTYWKKQSFRIRGQGVDKNSV
jgi:hypothetical protein